MRRSSSAEVKDKYLRDTSMYILYAAIVVGCCDLTQLVSCSRTSHVTEYVTSSQLTSLGSYLV